MTKEPPIWWVFLKLIFFITVTVINGLYIAMRICEWVR